MSDLCLGANENGLAKNAQDSAIATIPTNRAREQPQATRNSIAPITGAKYRGAHAGLTCDPSHAIASTASGSRISVNSLVASGPRRCARVNSGASPIAAASSSTIVILSPPSTLREIWTGAPNRGGVSHGAAVWAIWNSNVGAHGRYRIPAAT